MYISGQHTPVRIAFVGGGSLNWAMGLMADLAYDTQLAADVRLYDIDFQAAKRNCEIGNRFADVSRGQPATYKACETLERALNGADIVVISILPGQFSDMAQDLGIPTRFGIPQSVGDTVGPGGFIRALRAVPMMTSIAHSIRDHAPNAFVCNLTNPMSVLTGALFSAHPNIRAWGECHEVTKIRKQVAWIANQENGENKYEFRDVAVNVLGINHFTFVDAISLNGRDMLPAYRAFVAAYSNSGWEQSDPDKDSEHQLYFGSKNLVAFDLLRRFGIPAAAGDRHLAEFFPSADYLSDPQRWGFALTPVDYRIKDRKAKLARADSMRSGETPPLAHRSEEALIDQIKALMRGDTFVSNVNLPNQGQLAGLPKGTIVETNAVFSDLGVKPIFAGQLPHSLLPIVADHAARQTELLTATQNEDRGALFDLFHADPLVAHLQTKDAQDMFDQMLGATAAWLPETLSGAA
ncbi:alpha-galactosidase [uncultured Pelagimonas sp.]|uniref:family 4 glycosyl hydrolase n=1 Tax=uncultured Pelagimonas sp. TaxID=1618102 RepID=UPI002621B8FC|nr:alpha-galactosidase [uncultured Pelagimonas sp.]